MQYAFSTLSNSFDLVLSSPLFLKKNNIRTYELKNFGNSVVEGQQGIIGLSIYYQENNKNM